MGQCLKITAVFFRMVVSENFREEAAHHCTRLSWARRACPREGGRE